MKVFLYTLVLATSVMIASPANIAAATGGSGTLPSRESVSAILHTLESMDDPFIAALKALSPPSPGRGMYTIPEVEHNLALLKKMEALLKGITSDELNEPAKIKARSFLTKPSAQARDELEWRLRLFIRQLDRDVESPLWRELIPAKHTTPLVRLNRQLERQTNQLPSSQGPSAGSKVAPDGQPIVYIGPSLAIDVARVETARLETYGFVYRMFERLGVGKKLPRHDRPRRTDVDTLMTMRDTLEVRIMRVDLQLVSLEPAYVGKRIHLRTMGPVGWQTWGWQMPSAPGKRPLNDVEPIVRENLQCIPNEPLKPILGKLYQ